MKRKELLAVCENLIKSFNPEKTTIDSHAEEELRDYEENDRLFLQQVFYGVYRYKEILKSFLSNFYHANSSKIGRNDYTKFMIIAYLGIFRLEEMGFHAFSALVSAFDPTSMHVLLSYLFDPEILHGPTKKDWIRVLDQDFVEQKIIQEMSKFQPEVHQLLKHLHAKAFGRAAALESRRASGGIAVPVEKKSLTKPLSPRITKPKAQQVEPPIRIAQEVIVHPVPDLNRLTLADLEKQKEERQFKIKQETLDKYKNTAPPALEETKSNLEQIRQEVESKRNEELLFQFKAKPAPKFTSTSTSTEPIKLNTAAILREDALYKKKQAKEKQLIENYESELRDASDFYRWQKKMLDKDQDKWKQEIEQRRLAMVLAQHEAFEASVKTKMENRQIANEMKLIAQENQIKSIQEQHLLTEQNRTLVEDVKKHREVAPRMAEEKVFKEKQKQHDELTHFLIEEKKKKQQQDLIEQQQREDLIRQIRALDRLHKEHVVVFDPTQTAGLGLLEEMSLVELKERLQFVKQKQKEEEEYKRQSILQEKQDGQEELKQKIQQIQKIRTLASTSSTQAKLYQKQLEKQKQEEQKNQREKKTLELYEKINTKKKTQQEELAKLQFETEQISKKRLFLGAAKKMLEEKHFEQQKMAQERKAKQLQTNQKEEQQVYEEIKSTTKRLREEKAFQAKKTQQHITQETNVLLEQQRLGARLQSKKDLQMREQMVLFEKKRFDQAKERLDTRNLYATNMNAFQLTQAQRTRSESDVVLKNKPF